MLGDLEIKLITAKAEKYATANGAVAPEAAYVHRFNGYFQGMIDARGEQISDEQKSKMLLKEPSMMGALAPVVEPPVKETINVSAYI
jgi:hypothetical protein